MPEKIIKTTPPENDPVKHPNHYCYGKFECVEVIKELTAGAPGPEGFLLGNVIKYLWRYRRKNGVEDLKKARRYIDMLLRFYEEMDGGRSIYSFFSPLNVTLFPEAEETPQENPQAKPDA